MRRQDFIKGMARDLSHAAVFLSLALGAMAVAAYWFGPYSLMAEVDGVGHVLGVAMSESRCIDAMDAMRSVSIADRQYIVGHDASVYCIAP